MAPLLTETLGLGGSPTLLGNQRVVERRAKGETIYHMGFGESPFPTPERLQQALKREAHHKHYINTAGLPALREAIAAYYSDKYGLNPLDYDVIIAPGSKLFIYAMQMAYEGDLILPVPSWVSYEPQARLIGQRVIKVPAMLDDEGYHLDTTQLKTAIDNARANGLNPSKIILNSPNNLTGLRLSDKDQQEIATLCRREDIIIIADDIYGLVNFDGHHNPIARHAPEQTVISSALSKHLSLGGWRLGFGLIPKALPGLYDSLCQIASETWSAVAAPIQYAAIDPFSGHDVLE